jgi:long-chain fatty acid transport protein
MKYVYRGLSISVVVLLLVTGTAMAAGLSTFGVGARARGMGGAFRAIADDWSAAYWNPAGLAYLENNELDLTLLVVNPRSTYTPLESSDFMGTGFDIKGGERYPDDRPLPFPTFSGFIRLPSVEGLTFGAALYWAHDANYLWDLYDIPDCL